MTTPGCTYEYISTSRIRPSDLFALQHFLHPQACHVGGLRASPHHQLKSSALLHVVAPTLSIIMSLTNLRSLQIYVHLNLRILILLQVCQYRRVDTRCLMRKESTLTSTKHASVLASKHLKLVSCFKLIDVVGLVLLFPLRDSLHCCSYFQAGAAIAFYVAHSTAVIMIDISLAYFTIRPLSLKDLA